MIPENIRHSVINRAKEYELDQPGIVDVDKFLLFMEQQHGCRIHFDELRTKFVSIEVLDEAKFAWFLLKY